MGDREVSALPYPRTAGSVAAVRRVRLEDRLSRASKCNRRPRRMPAGPMPGRHVPGLPRTLLFDHGLPEET